MWMPAFGTGAVKVTPAHDPNDYAIGQRHQLPMINIMNQATRRSTTRLGRTPARIASRRARTWWPTWKKKACWSRPCRTPCRSASASAAREVIEPLLSEQWFVRAKPLAELALAAVKDGRTKIIPERFANSFNPSRINCLVSAPSPALRAAAAMAAAACGWP